MTMGPRYYVGLYATYFGLGVRMLAQFRADFGITALSATVREGAMLLFLSAIFGKITELQGWSFYELVLTFGLGTAVASFAGVFFSFPQSLGYNVRAGHLDVVLVRPAPALFQLLGQRCLDFSPAGSLVVGIAVVALALARLDLAFQAWWLLYLPLVLLSSALIAFSLNLIVACLAFRFVETGALLVLLGYVPEFSSYPLAIYDRPIRFTMTWILPYAMGSILPVGFLLGKEGYTPYGILAPTMGWGFLGLALGVWNVAARHYRSTGN